MVRYADWRQESHRLNELEVEKLAKRLCVSIVFACLLGALLFCLNS
jgi:hypothetical protein